MTNVSASSRIMEYIRANAPDEPLTSKELAERVGVTFGAASGFMAKLLAVGAFEKAGRKDGLTAYRIVDFDALDNVRVRLAPSIGSIKGRHRRGGRGSASDLPEIGDIVHIASYRGVMSGDGIVQYDLAATLLDAAAFAEGLMKRPPLEGFSTAELLDEIKRRMG